MFTFTLPLFPLLLLLLFFTITAAQPYQATDHFLLDCGSSSNNTSYGRIWQGDERSNFVPSNITTTSFSSTATFQNPSVPQIHFSTARIFNTSSFTYTFPASQGPKFLRLYFYPTTYSNLNANQSFFSVSSNGYSLLTNFSAFLTASFLGRLAFVREFIIYVKDTQILNVTFAPSPNSFAFINAIGIDSLPENLYFHAKNLKYIGQTSRPVIDEDRALEKIYRLNVGGDPIPGNNDTGMYRSWDEDDYYLFPPSVIGWTSVNKNPIRYTVDTPNYTAPDLVYATQRNMGNLGWRLPVDSGFHYMLRLHFCNNIPQDTKGFQVVFGISINNQTAEDEAHLLNWTQRSRYPVFKDYAVFVNDPDGLRSKQDLWLTMPTNPVPSSLGYAIAYLNGLEAFKLSMNGNLASPNPPPRSTSPKKRNMKKKKTPPYPAIIGGVGGGLVLLSVIVLIVLQQRRRVKHYGTTGDKSSWGLSSSESDSTKSCHSSLPSDLCRNFSLTEVKAATGEFNDNCVIGNGGFGKVYKGYIDNATTTVAIKRLSPSSHQGFHEFRTEIGMLSKQRHVHLVSLIGYCDEDGEMVLVYDYMPHGTLREHLYKTNPPLTWKRRLHICLGAAQGLQYLHMGTERGIIHRDIKSTNILLDEQWVAKVSDFGLSKLGPKHPSQTYVSTMVKGSFGYLDPEYCRTQQLTDKSDVYSFGVVLFEVLCARPVIVPCLPDEQVNLAEWGKDCYQRGTLHEIIDPKLKGEIVPECLWKFGEVANSCLKEQRNRRPTMDHVVWGLEYALQLQESAERMGGDAMPENQELPFLLQAESITMDHNGLENNGNVACKDVPPKPAFDASGS